MEVGVADILNAENRNKFKLQKRKNCNLTFLKNINMRKVKRNKWLLIAVLFASAFFTQGCDDDSIPSDILELLPKEYYQELLDNGFIFNLGETPPNVENIYDFEPENEYDNSGVFTPGSTAILTKWKFENQVGNALDVFIKNWTGVGLVDASSATIIKGEGNKFTIIAQAEGESGGIDYKYDYALTGTTSDDGIANAQFAFVMVENPGAPGVATQGTIRIFKDLNDLASETLVFRLTESTEVKGKGMFSN
jgi:hypothetical protein